jgi:4-amino-4-deoxy-L-arabinose transferase-like glycosyltransferase
LLLVILSIAAILRFHHLERRSIWLDEGMSIGMARLSFRGMFQASMHREINMALYYLLLKPWLTIGRSEAWIRGLSVLFGCATVIAVFWLGRRLFGIRAGLCAALLLAVNTIHIQYSQEARGYALAGLLVTASAISLVKAVEHRSGRGWAWYAIWSALAVYAHLYAMLVVISQWIWLAASRTRRNQGFGAMRFVCYLLIPAATAVLKIGPTPISWLPSLSRTTLVHTLVEFGGAGPIGLCLLLAASAIAVVSSLRSPGELRAATLLIAAWLILPFLIVMIGSTFHPMLIARYMMVCVPGLVLLAGSGLARLPRSGTVGGLTLICGLSLWTAHRSPGLAFDDWRSATNFLLSHAGPGDAALFYTQPSRAAFDYYRWRDRWQAEYPTVVWPAHEEAWRNLGVEPLAEVLPGIDLSHRRLWLVLAQCGAPDAPDFGSKALRAWIRPQYEPRSIHEFTGGIEVIEYEHR